MTRDEILRLAREAGLYHFYDSEGHCTGITNARLVDEDKARWDDRLVEMLAPFAALIEDHITFSSVHSCNPGCTKPACVAVRKAVEAEREACAKVADLVAREIDDTNGTATYIAAAIRSRT